MDQGKVSIEPAYCHPQHTGPDGTDRRHGWNGEYRECRPEGVKHYDLAGGDWIALLAKTNIFFIARNPKVGGDPAEGDKFSMGANVKKEMLYFQN